MSSAKNVYVIGAGGHGKVVVRLLEDLGHRVAAVFDDDPSRWGELLGGVSVIGPVARLAEHPSLPAVIAVGDNAARRRIAQRWPLEWITAVHPRAFVDRTARLGPGTVVLAGAVIQPDARIGQHVIVNTAASIDHDCLIGDYAHVAPGVHLAGGVTIEEGVLMGIGSVAIPGVTIGSGTTVGAGAAVVGNLPQRVVAVGVPAAVQGPAPFDHPVRAGHLLRLADSPRSL
ncbi:MAG: acetyltransferase [Thermoguttaceae bacterium]